MKGLQKLRHLTQEALRERADLSAKFVGKTQLSGRSAKEVTRVLRIVEAALDEGPRARGTGRRGAPWR